jgi:hypothetical protein
VLKDTWGLSKDTVVSLLENLGFSIWDLLKVIPKFF